MAILADTPRLADTCDDKSINSLKLLTLLAEDLQ